MHHNWGHVWVHHRLSWTWLGWPRPVRLLVSIIDHLCGLIHVVYFFNLVGTSLSSPVFGRIVDSRGPRILLACAFIFLIGSYSGIRLLYDSGLPPDAKSLPTLTFGALILCLSLVGSGGTAAYDASVNSTAKTFPDSAVSQMILTLILAKSLFLVLAWIDYGSGHFWLWIVIIYLLKRLSFVFCW